MKYFGILMIFVLLWINCTLTQEAMDTELHGRITLHLGISSFDAFYFAFVLSENLKRVWQRHESIV